MAGREHERSVVSIVRPGFAAVLGALACGLLFAPSASASDTFTLTNGSRQATLTGVSNWRAPDVVGPQSLEGCRSGPFPALDSTAYTFRPGDSGSVTLSQDPFSSCPGALDTQSFNLIRQSQFGNGWWAPVDPLIGFAVLTCGVPGQNPVLVTSRVDELTCTISDTAATASASFVSSAAPVRNGDAVALVQHFPGSARRAGSVQGLHEITLRDRKGHVNGRKRAMLVSGRPRRVHVALSRALRRKVAKRGFSKVEATLKRIDGKPGTGHRATLVVMRDSPSLPF